VASFDQALIERVLHNLVGNAVRYCDDGAIRLTARIWNSLEGPSVPATMRDRLFAKYAKGSNGKRGFGLYFCRLACEAHGGTIEYVAAPDGSTFRLRLPVRH
jgi:two-component system, OmpR family, heavy metal sensor histidine kinase CusS